MRIRIVRGRLAELERVRRWRCPCGAHRARRWVQQVVRGGKGGEVEQSEQSHVTAPDAPAGREVQGVGLGADGPGDRVARLIKGLERGRDRAIRELLARREEGIVATRID